MKIWVTQQALTKGIYTAEAEVWLKATPYYPADTTGRTVRVAKSNRFLFDEEWAITEAEAVKHANAIRQREITRLLRQRDRFPEGDPKRRRLEFRIDSLRALKIKIVKTAAEAHASQ